MAQKPTAEAGILYVVPTPVGNLDDMTVRAVNVLKEVDVILAEDTRTSGVLMKHFGIETRMQSHHKFNEHETAAGIAQRDGHVVLGADLTDLVKVLVEGVLVAGHAHPD